MRSIAHHHFYTDVFFKIFLQESIAACQVILVVLLVDSNAIGRAEVRLKRFEHDCFCLNCGCNVSKTHKACPRIKGNCPSIAHQPEAPVVDSES